MRYIYFHGSTGYCGTDYHEFGEFPDETEDSIIEDISQNYAHDNADSYSYLATGWDDFETEQDEEDYYEDAYSYCGWEEISKEEHDKLKEEYEF